MSNKEKPVIKGVLFQSFHWFLKPEDNLWQQLTEKCSELSQAGFTAIWLPPPYKAMEGINDAGYGVYDLWDMGEFDQKDTVRTKYGSFDELKRLISEIHKYKMQAYLDIVLNHKDGADQAEDFEAWEVEQENRLEKISEKKTISAFTKFTFPGRNKKYSDFEWSWRHFAWVSHHKKDDQIEKGVFQIKDILWQEEVSEEHGSYDFLLGCDIDHGDDEVRADLFKWGEWVVNELKIDGFRLDALKHIRFSFFNDWLDELRKNCRQDLPSIGEFWSQTVDKITDYLDKTEGRTLLFDVPLHYNFQEASNSGKDFDLTQIFKDSLISKAPLSAVTFVENHDTQPASGIESNVQEWFKPLAYALILLRAEGYPAVFYADYYGAKYEKEGKAITLASHKDLIDKLLNLRKAFEFSEQHDYFDNPQCIAWCVKDNDKSFIAIMSSDQEGTKTIETGMPDCEFTEIINGSEKCRTDSSGKAEFRCPAGKLAVWVS